MYIVVIGRCHGMQSARTFSVGESLLIGAEANLGFRQRHQTVGIARRELDRTFPCLQAGIVITMHRKAVAQDLISKREVGLKAHCLARLGEPEIEISRLELASDFLGGVDDMGQGEESMRGSIARVETDCAPIHGTGIEQPLPVLRPVRERLRACNTRS